MVASRTTTSSGHYRLAEEDAEQVRTVGQLAVARAVADGLDAHLGDGLALRQRRDDGGAGRRDQLGRAVLESDRAAGDQQDHGRGRYRQRAVRRAQAPLPHGQRPGVDGLDAQVHEAERRPHHVHDRVERSHLVELDRVGGDAMHAPLGLGQACEDGERALLHRRGQAAPGEQVADLRPGAVPVVVRGRPLVRALAVHARVELGRRDARARHALDRDLDTGERERRDRLAQRRERQAEVEQRAHRHVAADARERVQVGDPHHGPPR